MAKTTPAQELELALTSAGFPGSGINYFCAKTKTDNDAAFGFYEFIRAIPGWQARTTGTRKFTTLTRGGYVIDFNFDNVHRKTSFTIEKK